MKVKEDTSYPDAKEALEAGIDVFVVHTVANGDDCMYCHVIFADKSLAEQTCERLGWRKVNPLDEFTCLLADDSDVPGVIERLGEIEEVELV